MIQPTKQQRLAIESRGANLLVSASAGSGKTSVMIKRILGLLDEVSLENMVICTFTRASAADMREKLQEELMERASGGDVNAERQLLLLPTANISTIHSWCQKLIKTYFYALDGVDPTFDILDEGEAESLLAGAVDEAVEEAYASGDDTFLLLSDVMLSSRSDRKLKALITSIYHFMSVQADTDEWLSGDALLGQNDPALVEEMLSELLKPQRDGLHKRAVALKEDIYLKKLDKFYKLADALVNALETDDEVELPKTSSAKLEPTSEYIKDECKELRAAVKKFTDKRREIYSYPTVSSNPEFLHVLIALVKSARDKYAAVKIKKARLDYEDLEHYACKLMEDAEIRAQIMKSCTYVFVDEFQDINPLQDRIIRSVTGAHNLFLVGDVKQSIYAFRNCDPNIFVDKYVNYARHGLSAPIELNENFRSHDQIIKYVNSVFEPLMTNEFGRVDYKGTAALVRGRELFGGEVKLNLVVKREKVVATGVYSVEHGDDDDRRSINAETDMVVANIVRQLKEGTVPCTEKVVENGEIVVRESVRAAECKDIAVLMRARGGYVTMLCEKLKRVGINACVSDKIEFSSVYEVSVLQQFMRYVVSFTDDIAMVAVLSSPAYKLTNDELACVKLSSSCNEFNRACRQYAATHDDELAQKLNGFFADMARYRELSHTLTAAELVGRFVSEKKWFLHALNTDNADYRADAVSAFLQSVSDNKLAVSVREYVDYLELRGDSFERSPQENAVKIMTIHASKGLQFPFVHLVGTSGNFTSDRSEVIFSRRLGLCLKDYDVNTRKVQGTRLTELAKMLNKRELNEERMRLLYVALTRAEQSLNIYAVAAEKDKLFTGDAAKCVGEEASSFFDWLRPSYATYGFERRALDAEFAPLSAVAATDCDVDGVISAAREYFGFEYKHNQRPIKSSVTAMNRDSAENEKLHYIGDHDDRAAKRGTAYHLAMELLDLDADFDAEWARLSKLSEIAEWVEKEDIAAAAEIVRKLTFGMTVYREKQFVYNLGGAMVQGVIDLLAVSGEECILLDYKTSPPEIVENGAYDMQMAVYAGALKDVLGLNPTRILVYCFKNKKIIEISSKKIVEISDKIKKTV